MLSSILTAYGFDPKKCVIKTFGNGLINNTMLLTYAGNDYILQKINKHVFKNPFHISDNIGAVAKYLKKHFPGYLFVTPIITIENKDLVCEGEDYYRVFPFVKNSVTFTTLESPRLAYEAARQFGKFTHLLSGFNTNILKEILPNFHNLTLRYNQLKEALSQGNKERIAEAQEDIKQIKQYKYIANDFEQIGRSPFFKKRVTHHDTKISNVLFDNENNGLCVIDLDTVMPGYFISDFGDMMRTYLSPAGEEEKDFAKIKIREDYFDAIVQGYLSEMNADLTEAEQNSLVDAGKFMIYMQAIRFLADYLQNDLYYGSKYEGHNLVRAKNQLYLLNLLHEKEEQLNRITKRRRFF